MTPIFGTPKKMTNQTTIPTTTIMTTTATTTIVSTLDHFGTILVNPEMTASREVSVMTGTFVHVRAMICALVVHFMLIRILGTSWAMQAAVHNADAPLIAMTISGLMEKVLLVKTGKILAFAQTAHFQLV